MRRALVCTAQQATGAAVGTRDESEGLTTGSDKVEATAVAAATVLDEWLRRELSRGTMRFRLMRGAVSFVCAFRWAEEQGRQEG